MVCRPRDLRACRQHRGRSRRSLGVQAADDEYVAGSLYVKRRSNLDVNVFGDSDRAEFIVAVSVGVIGRADTVASLHRVTVYSSIGDERTGCQC